MKVKTTVLCVTAVLVLAVTPSLSIAQGVHSQFSIAQPQAPFPPTQTPAIATRIPFANVPAGSLPIGIIQAPIIAPNPVFIPNQTFFPNQTVVVPNPVFAPNPVFIPTQPVFSNPFVLPNTAAPSFQMPSQVMPPTQLLAPGQTVIPATPPQFVTAPVQSFFGPPSVPQEKSSAPAPGTSRVDVLKQFGQPIATVGTSMGETLYFSDGTKVTLQNDQVTGSK